MILARRYGKTHPLLVGRGEAVARKFMELVNSAL